MSLARTLRTVRHLRPSQILWRLRYAVERRKNLYHGTGGGRWAWKASTPPVPDDRFPDLPIPSLPGPRGAAAVETLAGGVVEHLNQASEIGRERPDWRLGARSTDRLWTVTLHYHGWAYAVAEAAATDAGGNARRAAKIFRHYVGDWIHRCGIERPGSSALAWNSYAIATRLGWWIRAYRVARAEIFADHEDFEASFLQSSWQQAAYLYDHLEWDLRANHLMRDLVGLASAGRFFRHPKARKWLRRADGLALEQAVAQVLPDGGGFERSPTYHLEVMEDLLQLALLTRDGRIRAALGQRWAAMAEWIAWMRYPDGATAQFNDGGIVSGAVVEGQLRAGERLDVRVDRRGRSGGRFFADTGLVVYHGDRWTVFFDVGPLGPDEQPGHGHADTLSFECAWCGHRLVVDPGTFGYDADRRRRYDRATAAHNTVTIDGLDSSEVWHVFRAGRRARPRDVCVKYPEEDGLLAGAAHDGYDHLPGRPRHHRTLSLREGGSILQVDDEIRGGQSHRLEGGLLIGPAWRVRPAAAGWIVQAGDERVSVTLEGTGVERRLEKRWYHPDYGVERQASWVGWRWRGGLPFRVRWTLAADPAQAP